MTGIVLYTEETKSFSPELKGIYKNNLHVDNEDGFVFITTQAVDENDERDVYFKLDKVQCLMLSDILKTIGRLM